MKKNYVISEGTAKMVLIFLENYKKIITEVGLETRSRQGREDMFDLRDKITVVIDAFKIVER